MSAITKYTKSTIIAALKDIRSQGWIRSRRNVHNDGAIGNTLEDLLAITKYTKSTIIAALMTLNV